VRGVIRRTARGRDDATPVYLHLGVIGIVGAVVLVVLAVALPLYYALGGK
jgi:hypothetical protein